MQQPAVIHESRANLQLHPRAIEAAGGRLRLTTVALTFLPHELNVTVREPIAIPLGRLAAAVPVRQRVFGLLPSPLSNAILLTGVDATFEYVVVVPDRRRWVTELNKLISAHRAMERSLTRPGSRLAQPMLAQPNAAAGANAELVRRVSSLRRPLPLLLGQHIPHPRVAMLLAVQRSDIPPGLGVPRLVPLLLRKPHTDVVVPDVLTGKQQRTGRREIRGR